MARQWSRLKKQYSKTMWRWRRRFISKKMNQKCLDVLFVKVEMKNLEDGEFKNAHIVV